jgi:putative transposase
MDFAHGQLTTGRKLRVLTIIDIFSPAIVLRLNFRAPDVIEVLQRVGREIGLPKTIQVDQGRKFISRDLDLWAYQRDVTLDFSRRGKQTDNAFIDHLNRKFRAECMNVYWSMSLDDAAQNCEAWRREYNEVHPHSSIGSKVPIERANRSEAHGPP